MSGASLEKPEYQLQGFGPGRERARILFPRMCLNRKFQQYNWPKTIAFQSNVLRIVVLEQPWPVEAGVIYRLSRRLELIDVELSDSLLAAHRQLKSAGQLDHPLGEAEVAELRRLKVLKPFRPAAEQLRQAPVADNAGRLR